MSAIYLTHAAEIYTTAGPTGTFAAVTAGEAQDYGGNVLFAGSANQCVQERMGFRVPTRLVPTEWHRAEGEVAGARNHWQPVIA